MTVGPIFLIGWFFFRKGLQRVSLERAALLKKQSQTQKLDILKSKIDSNVEGTNPQNTKIDAKFKTEIFKRLGIK